MASRLFESKRLMKKNRTIPFSGIMLEKPGFHNFEYGRANMQGVYQFDSIESSDPQIITKCTLSINDRGYNAFKKEIRLRQNKEMYFVICLVKKAPKNIHILKSKKKLSKRRIGRLINRRFNRSSRGRRILNSTYYPFRSSHFFIEI